MCYYYHYCSFFVIGYNEQNGALSVHCVENHVPHQLFNFAHALFGYTFLEGKRKNKTEYCLPSSSVALRIVSHKVSIKLLTCVWLASSGLLETTFFTFLANEGFFCFDADPRIRVFAGVDCCDTVMLY
jgi:hypothetical protein